MMETGERELQGLVVAAGLSRRMGDFKPLLPMNGRTMIEQTILSMLCAGVRRVVVVLGHRGEEVEAVLRNSGFRDRICVVYNRDYSTTEMLDSIKLGAAALHPRGDFFLLPGDVPMVSPGTFRAVREAHLENGKDVTFPALAGRRKHPPLISAFCIGQILAYHGENGLRGLWAGMEDRIGLVPVDDLGCTMDVDEPRDYRRALQYLEDPAERKEAEGA